MRLSTLCLLILSVSCTPEKRLARLLKKNPGLVKSDTTWRNDTIFISERRVDTVFYFNQRDTVIKESNGAIIKYYFNSSDSTVYLEGKCKGDTIYKRYPVIVNTVSAPPESTFKMISGWLPLLAMAVLILVLWRKLK